MSKAQAQSQPDNKGSVVAPLSGRHRKSAGLVQTDYPACIIDGVGSALPISVSPCDLLQRNIRFCEFSTTTPEELISRPYRRMSSMTVNWLSESQKAALVSKAGELMWVQPTV